MMIDTTALTAPPEDYASLSVEPEGLSPLGYRVFFVSSVKIHRGAEEGTFSCYAKCGPPGPVSASGRRGRPRDSEDELLPAEAALRELLSFAGGATLVIHGEDGAGFLRGAAEGWDGLPCPVADLLELARQRLPHLPSHTLPELRRYFCAGNTGSRLPNARAIAVAFERCCRLEPSPDAPRTWLPEVPPCPPRPAPPRGFPEIRRLDFEHPLFAKAVVFAGSLVTPRRELSRLAAERGATVRARVSPLTDMLVAGANCAGSLERAHALNAAGRARIEIISEEEFVRLAHSGTEELPPGPCEGPEGT